MRYVANTINITKLLWYEQYFCVLQKKQNAIFQRIQVIYCVRIIKEKATKKRVCQIYIECCMSY